MKEIIADQQRQLAGELVPLRQQLDRPVVGGDHAETWPTTTASTLIVASSVGW